MTGEFWKDKKPAEFTTEEWESVCTRCGRCCLIKLQDEKDDAVYYTRIICRYFNDSNCSCTEYANRCRLVPECIKLSPDNWNQIGWMPQDCAYRILAECGDLPEWHPLKTGKPLEKTRSVKNKTVSEKDIPEEEWEDYILEGGENDL